MPEFVSFNSTVALRTEVAEHVLHDPGLLARFERNGGLREDLKAIAAAGRLAQRRRVGRARATAERRAAVQDTKEALADLQREHQGILAVLAIVRHELERSGGSGESVALARDVGTNKGQRRVRTQANAQGERVYRARSREAMRAEIEKDATLLLARTDLHERLARRGVSVARLEGLQQSAQALGRQLMRRTTSEGKRVTALGRERDAVREQKELWAVCYRILRRTAREDWGLADLLRQAGRRRKRGQ